MGFKKLTGHGVLFIATICKGTGNSLLKGKMKYPLKNSNVLESTIFEAHPNYKGNLITTNEDLGVALIGWFNQHAKTYEIDANIIAAQAFAESGYRLFAHSSSGAMGISQFLASTLYDTVIGNRGAAKTVVPVFSEDEIDKLTLYLDNPRQEKVYIYYNNPTFVDVAVKNKSILFQNMMNNPDLVIKAQCRLMKGISKRSSDVAASTLFGYNQGPSYVRSTYTETIKVSEKKLKGTDRLGNGQQYVYNIFKMLGDVDSTQLKPKGIWFGYDINLTEGSFDVFEANRRSSDITVNNVDETLELSKHFTLADLMVTSTGIKNIPNEFEISNLKALAINVLEPIITMLEPITNLVDKKLIVNSGFRSSLVNSKVKGVIDSQHRIGQAADIRLKTNDPKILEQLFYDIIASDIVYDQIIFETKSETNVLRRWIHISYLPKGEGNNRKNRKLAKLVNEEMQYTSLA